MKNKGVTILLIITNIILIAMLCSFISKNENIVKEKEITKEMSESTQVTDLNNQINALNTEHTEYMNYTQTCKAQLASAITDMGVETSENADATTMASNIISISRKGDLQNTVYYNSSTSSSFTYTVNCDYDGLFVCVMGGGNQGTDAGKQYVKKNDVSMSSNRTSYQTTWLFPVSKGDTVKLYRPANLINCYGLFACNIGYL